MQQMEKDRRDSIFVCGTTGGLAVFLAPPQEAVKLLQGSCTLLHSWFIYCWIRFACV